MDFKNYTVKNVKIFNGMDGQGFNAILYNGTKKIAEVINNGSGGETRFHFYPDTRNEENILREHCKSLPKEKLLDSVDKLYDVSIDWFMDNLINEYYRQKDIKKMEKLCQTKTLYSLKGEKKGKYYIIPKIFNEGMKILLTQKYGNNLAEIINETLNDNKIPEILS